MEEVRQGTAAAAAAGPLLRALLLLAIWGRCGEGVEEVPAWRRCGVGAAPCAAPSAREGRMTWAARGERRRRTATSGRGVAEEQVAARMGGGAARMGGGVDLGKETVSIWGKCMGRSGLS